MFFSPHKLFVRREDIHRDEYGRPIKNGERWEEVCQCRCDDNGETEIVDDNGLVYRPQYHIVCPDGVKISSGDYIKVMHGDKVRGEGKAVRPKRLNFLKYFEVWV